MTIALNVLKTIVNAKIGGESRVTQIRTIIRSLAKITEGTMDEGFCVFEDGSSINLSNKTDLMIDGDDNCIEYNTDSMRYERIIS